jgi:hypothetical protein
MYSFPSLKRATVRPADVVPIPVVMTERIEIFEAKLKSYDFPVPGSPIINMWICPRILGSFSWHFCTPPITESKIPNFSGYLS